MMFQRIAFGLVSLVILGLLSLPAQGDFRDLTVKEMRAAYGGQWEHPTDPYDQTTECNCQAVSACENLDGCGIWGEFSCTSALESISGEHQRCDMAAYQMTCRTAQEMKACASEQTCEWDEMDNECEVDQEFASLLVVPKWCAAINNP